MMFSFASSPPLAAPAEPGAGGLADPPESDPALPVLRVQPLLLAEGDLDALRAALGSVGDELGLQVQLDGRDGDIVLLDPALAQQVSPQLIAAFSEGRPCITLGRQGEGDLRQPGAWLALRQQLLALPLVQRRLRSAGLPGSTPDLPWDAEVVQQALTPEARSELQRAQQLLQFVARRRDDPQAAPLPLSYGAQAALRLDFREARAQADVRALQALRLQREWPRLTPDIQLPAAAAVLPLDQALWDLGVAAARLPLLDAPDRWWLVPVSAPEAVTRGAGCTRVPSTLEVLRCLAEAPVSPADVRRLVRISVGDLRRVLQPLLLLGLARWSTPLSSFPTGIPPWMPDTARPNPTPQPASSC